MGLLGKFLTRLGSKRLPVGLWFLTRLSNTLVTIVMGASFRVIVEILAQTRARGGHPAELKT